MSGRVPMSQETFTKLKDQLEHLKMFERPKIIKEIAEARGNGDLSENAEYHAAREKQGHIEDQIRILEDKIARSEIIQINAADSETVIFGATVKAKNCETSKIIEYTLVGPEGVNVAENKISSKSPIGQGLMGKRVGDIAEIDTPRGKIKLEVLSFR